MPVESATMTTDAKFTRCPGCSTVFRVTVAQLALREGQVRCGHCRAVFDANDHVVSLDVAPGNDFDMTDELIMGRPTVTLRSADALDPIEGTNTVEVQSAREQASVAETISADGPPDASSSAGDNAATIASIERGSDESSETVRDEVPSPTSGDAALDMRTDDEADRSRPSKAVGRDDASQSELDVDLERATKPVERASAVTDSVEGQTPVVQDKPSVDVDVSDADASALEPANRDGKPTIARLLRSESAVDASLDSSSSADGAIEHETPDTAKTGSDETRSASEEGTSSSGSSPRSIVGNERASQRQDEPQADVTPIDLARPGPSTRFEWKKRNATEGSRRRLLTAAAGVLAVAIVVQVVLEFRDTLAARVPVTRPLLEAACSAFGCTIEPLRDAAALSIDASDLQADPAHRGLLLLSATIRNRSSHAIAYPFLELTLTDASDQVVARRAFTPAEYAAGTADAHVGIPANGERVVRMFLDASATQQAGYRLYLFYP